MPAKVKSSKAATKNDLIQERDDCLMEWTNGAFQSISSSSVHAQRAAIEHIPGHSVGIRSRDPVQLIKALKKGLPASAFDNLQKKLGIASADLARIANIAIRTLQRRREQGRFQPVESERLLRIGVLYDMAAGIFDGDAAVRQWMKTPKKPLGGKTPLEYCDTEPGAREVEDLLGRIEHGVFS